MGSGNKGPGTKRPGTKGSWDHGSWDHWSWDHGSQEHGSWDLGSWDHGSRDHGPRTMGLGAKSPCCSDHRKFLHSVEDKIKSAWTTWTQVHGTHFFANLLDILDFLAAKNHSQKPQTEISRTKKNSLEHANWTTRASRNFKGHLPPPPKKTSLSTPIGRSVLPEKQKAVSKKKLERAR